MKLGQLSAHFVAIGPLPNDLRYVMRPALPFLNRSNGDGSVDLARKGPPVPTFNPELGYAGQLPGVETLG